jgi:hypothetical protein
MDYVPDVAAFKKLSFKGADSYVCESKLKRVRPFYKEQFEYIKSIVSPEVSIIFTSCSYGDLTVSLLGVTRSKNHHVCSGMVPPPSWSVRLQPGCV